MATERETLQIAIETKGAEAAEAELTRIDKMVEGLSAESAIITLSLEAARVETQLMDLRQQIVQLGDQAPIELKIETAQAEAQLNAVEAKLKSTLDMAPVDVKLSATNAISSIDRLSGSARGANSALANMVGNAAQDLGAVAGVAGSAGVAIGQMAEYAADAVADGERLGAALGSMAKVAGPIAALGVSIQAVSTYMAGIKAEETFKAETARDFAAAMKEVADNAKAVKDSIAEIVDETARLDFSEAGGGFLGLGRSAGDLLPVLDRLGIGLNEFNEMVLDVEPSLQSVRDEIKAMTTAKTPWDSERLADLQRLVDGLEQYGDAAEKAAEADERRAEINRERARDEVTEKRRVDALADAYTEQMVARHDIAEAARDQAAADAEAAEAQAEAEAAAHDLTEELRRQADELRKRATALGEASASLREMEGAFDTMAQREGAIERVFALGNAPLDAQADLRDITIAIDELSETAADLDLSKGIKFGDISLDPLLDAFDQLRPQIQQQIANAFEGGGPEAARTVAQGFVDNIFTELGGKVSKEDIARALGMEGGIDAFINVIVEQSAIDKAKRQLEVLTGLPGADPVYTAAIALALDAGTITGAQASALVLDAIGQVIPLPTGVEPPSAASVAAAKAALFGEDWPIPLVYQAPQTSIEEVIGIPDAVRLPTTFEPMPDAAQAMYAAAAATEPIPFGTAFTPPEQSIEEIIGTPPAIQVPYELTPGPVSIEEAIGIPPAVQVPTSADVTGATSDIAGFAGGPHPKATVAVEADSAGADAEIDGVASQGRTARIAVETSGVGAASSAIANAARNRTATITVNYVVGAVPRIDGARR